MRLTVLAAVLIVIGSASGITKISAAEVPVAMSRLNGTSAISIQTPSILAQAYSDSSNSSSSGSTRVRTRGLGKVIGLAIAGIVALGSFVVKLFRGRN